MESNKHNIENFERFLREKTDEFKMYPSKRVWYSIYNNMHPGNRLPSVSMSIILIGFLFLVGYLNTDVNKEAVPGKEFKPKAGIEQLAVADAQKTGTNNQPSIEIAPAKPTGEYSIVFQGQLNNNNLQKENTVSYTRASATAYSKKRNSITQSQILTTAISNPGIETVLTGNESSSLAAGDGDGQRNIASSVNSADVTATGNNDAALLNNNNTGVANNIIVNEDELSNKEVVDDLPVSSVPALTATTPSLSNKEEAATNTAATKTNNPVAAKPNTNTGLSLADKAWIEDFALHNRPVKKWAGKLSLQAYITPSVVYRKLRNNAEDKMLTGTNTNFNAFNAEQVVTHKASFGVETGVSLQYDIAKRIRLKAGMQLNYTRYNAHAYETNHPIATSITMNEVDKPLTYELFRTSNYSNAFGLSPVKLHNETYQVSLPIGADIKLASVENLSLYAGATIQPTMILYAKSYIISTDRRSYVEDPSLLNRFNLNAGFEAYVSYKTNSGYTWQLGPQYRMQIFSTNNKLYSVEERLRNYGFKIGVTKRL